MTTATLPTNNLIEQLREYSNNNGGHATNAAAAGVTLASWIACVSGQAPGGPLIAAYAASVLNVNAAKFMAVSPDVQLLALRGAVP